MMYKEIGGEVVDLNFHKFMYNEKEYTQLQLIDMMLDRLKVYFVDEYDGQPDYVDEIAKIWAIVLPAMWW